MLGGAGAVAAAAARLETVAGIGPVYNMLSDAVQEAQFKARFSDGTRIHAWEVTREGSTSVDETAQAYSRAQQVVMHGYYSFKDGVSEPVFQALVDAVCLVFDPFAERRFPDGEGNAQFDWTGPLQIEGPKFAMKGNYLIHYVRMVFPMREYPL